MSDYKTLSPAEVKDTAGAYYQQRAPKTAAKAEPVYILVGAQPGAGKSAAASIVRSGLVAQGGYIHVDADRMRERIDTRGTTPSSDETQQDAGRLVAELRRQAIDGQRNILEEGTFRNPDSIGAFLDARRADGYQLEMVAVATARDESLLGIYQRFEAQHAAGSNNPRFVSAEYHDDAMKGFDKTLAQHAEKFSRVRVVNRAGEVLFDTRNADRDGPSAVKALREGQTLTDAKLKAVAASWVLLEGHAKARSADPEYLSGLVRHKQACEVEMQARMRTHAITSLEGHYGKIRGNSDFRHHEKDELVKAAYFRGIYEKSSEFKGVSPDFKAYDTKMGNRETLRQLPDVPELEVPEETKTVSRNQAAERDDMSL